MNTEKGTDMRQVTQRVEQHQVQIRKALAVGNAYHKNITVLTIPVLFKHKYLDNTVYDCGCRNYQMLLKLAKEFWKTFIRATLIRKVIQTVQKWFNVKLNQSVD